MPAPLALIIGSAALTAAGTALNNRAKQQADAQQAAIIQNQRLAYDEQRDMVKERQALLDRLDERDTQRRQEATERLQTMLPQMGGAAAQEDVDTEASRLAAMMATDTGSAGGLNESLTQPLTGGSGAYSNRVIGHAEDQASALADTLAARRAALSRLTGYGTGMETFGRRIGASGLDQNVRARQRANWNQNAKDLGDILQSGVDAQGAAGKALGLEYVPLDTSKGDALISAGQMGLGIAGGMGGLGAGTQAPAPVVESVAHTPWTQIGQAQVY